MLTTPPAVLRAGLTKAEVARLLSVSEKTLWNWARSGFGPQPIRDGARLLYDPAQVEAFAAGAVA
jgi:DNA-binding transcriptional MerR regulator